MSFLSLRISVFLLAAFPCFSFAQEMPPTIASHPASDKEMNRYLAGGHSVPHEVARHSALLNTASLACDTLQTTLTGTNGNDGIMFDINAFRWLTITQLAAHLNPNADSGYVKVYYKMGSWNGADSIQYASQWTFIDSAMVTGAGFGTATLIPVNINVTVPAGESVAFYITGTGAVNVAYSNGTLAGGVHASDTMMQVRQGVGKAYPFGGHYNPRIFNGQVFYCEAPVGVEETGNSINSIGIHPNPFSAQAMIAFSRPVSSAVISICDVLGKEVKRLNAFNTDKINISSDGMNSGIYFIRVIENGALLGTKKMIVE